VHAVIVIGTRPQIIKSAPIIKEAVRRGMGLDVVHTGQHYDYEMSRVFFKELGLPDPVVNLGVGSGSHGEQTGRMPFIGWRIYPAYWY
jgi:UDP-N-acetylglucosamine 2-epimerase